MNCRALLARFVVLAAPIYAQAPDPSAFAAVTVRRTLSGERGPCWLRSSHPRSRWSSEMGTSALPAAPSCQAQEPRRAPGALPRPRPAEVQVWLDQLRPFSRPGPFPPRRDDAPARLRVLRLLDQCPSRRGMWKAAGWARTANRPGR